MPNAIEVKEISKHYQGFHLEKISFELPPGSIMGFVGENGAGKTTTLKLLMNVVNKDTGSIKIFGLDHLKDEREIKEQVGVVFDSCNFHDTLNAIKIGKIMARIYRNWDQRSYEEYLKKFELPKDKNIKDYSKGMKMRLSIAVALAHHPRLLLLDEATGGLDPASRCQILDILMEFIQKDDHSILFSSHITSDLDKIADYITFIHQGRIVFSKNKDELIYNYGIVKCGRSDFEKLDKEDVLRYKTTDFGCEVLVKNKKTVKRKYPMLVIDNPNLEDIMVFYIRGEAI